MPFFYVVQHLQSQYDELVRPLCTEHPDIFPIELFTWEKFLWACELWYSNSMKIMFPDGEVRTCLVPVAGFLNHSVSVFTFTTLYFVAFSHSCVENLLDFFRIQ